MAKGVPTMDCGGPLARSLDCPLWVSRTSKLTAAMAGAMLRRKLAPAEHNLTPR
jgi:hypothetical protein